MALQQLGREVCGPAVIFPEVIKKTYKTGLPSLFVWLALAVAPFYCGTAQHNVRTKSTSASSPIVMTAKDAETFRAALTQYNNGDAAGAADTLTLLAARYPRNAEAQSAAGMSMLESGQLSNGVALLERSAKLKPLDAPIRQNLAVAYLHLNRANDAVAQLDAVISKSPANFEAWLARGQALTSAGRFQEAIRSYERADALVDQKNSSAVSDLLSSWASTTLAAGNPRAALLVLQRHPSVDSDPQSLEVRAEAYEKSGEYTKAVTDFRRAAELAPAETFLLAYGEELLRHWTFPAAASIFEYGVKLFPKSEALRKDLGVAYFGNNDFIQAGNIFGALLAEHPADASLGDLLGRSCAALATDSSPACSQLPAFAAAHPGNAPAALYAAIALLHKPEDTGAYAQAGTLLQAALRSDPKLAEAWYQMGVLQQGNGDWAGSAGSLEHAIELNPAYPEAHYRLSRAYYHLGRSDAAKQQMQLQQSTAAAKKEQDNHRMQEVLTFVTETH